MPLDPLEERLCRLCFGEENSLTDIFEDTAINIKDIVSRHIGEVSIAQYGFETR